MTDKQMLYLAYGALKVLDRDGKAAQMVAAHLGETERVATIRYIKNDKDLAEAIAENTLVMRKEDE